MPDTTEEWTGGGENRPSESEENVIGAVSKITNHLARMASGLDGNLLPNAEFQIAVRDPEDRAKILEQLVLEVCPAGVDQAAWRAWLHGGKSPFEIKPRKPAPGKERPAQTLVRSSNAVSSQMKRIDRARADLEEAEQQLAYVKAYENAAVHWYVVDQLLDIMRPAFSMGPAWTIMRALSSYVSDEAADRATPSFIGEEKPIGMSKYREIRLSETREMLASLDWFSGYEPFENELRDAILRVVREFDHRRSEAATDGRRPRSEKTMKEHPHPKAMADAEQVIEGLAVEEID